jgi:two-component system chemotaxis response regulator CheB
MIVDDSAIARAVLSRMLAAFDDFTIVAQAGNAEEALATLRHQRVDIVLLDVEMPGTSGLEALPDILAAGQGARVLIVSSQCEAGAEAAVKALAMGAADTLPKPGAEHFGGRFSAVLAERLRRIGRAETGQGREDAPPMPAPLPLRAAPQARVACLAIGASTGGLHAIGELLRALPERLSAPLLVTQHLPPLFVPFFARQLESACGRVARVAEDGLVLAPEEIVLAPGDAHLSLEQHGSRVKVKLNRESAASGCMPSVDVMLAAVAETYGKSGVGVVLTGMGRDGLEGSRRLAARGGAVLAQDQQSCAVWGMPRAVAEAGLACAVLPPAQIARRIGARIADTEEARGWK